MAVKERIEILGLTVRSRDVPSRERFNLGMQYDYGKHLMTKKQIEIVSSEMADEIRTPRTAGTIYLESNSVRIPVMGSHIARVLKEFPKEGKYKGIIFRRSLEYNRDSTDYLIYGGE